MYHRSEHEFQGMFSRYQFFTVFYDYALVFQVGEEALQENLRLCVHDDLHFGIFFRERFDRRAVVGFHMLYDQIRGRFAVQSFIQIFQIRACERAVRRVENHGIFVREEIGIVCNAVVYGIDVFEQMDASVRYADVIEVLGYFLFHNIFIILYPQRTGKRKRQTRARFV